MHDIVKAVGNCSYNQLVEKIISCKQSDNSELAGEGECFLFTLSHFLTSLTPLEFRPHLFTFTFSIWDMHRWTDQCKHVLHRDRVELKPGHTVHVATHQMTYFHGSQFPYRFVGNFTKSICSFNTELPEQWSAGLLPSLHIKALVDGDTDTEDSLLLLCFCICSVEVTGLSGLMPTLPIAASGEELANTLDGLISFWEN